MPIYPTITYHDEDNIPDVTKATNLHIRVGDGKKLMKIKPIDGLVIHINGLPILEFLSNLTYNWVKTIKYLRIWSDGKYCCTIYNDKCTMRCKSMSKLTDRNLMNDYYAKMTDNSTKPIYFSDIPYEIKNIQHLNKLLIVDDKLLHGIGMSKSLCYRHCMVSVLWMMYFIASKHERIIDNDQITYKSIGTLTDIHRKILIHIKEGSMRYLTDEEISYIDNVYYICHSIDILHYGRECKAHP